MKSHQYVIFLGLIGAIISFSPAFALNCETEVSKFDYTNDTPSTFSFGDKSDVDKAYKKLAETVGYLDMYSKPVVFFSKGYTGITQYFCPGEKCTSQDIGKGFSICSARGMSAADSCYPLAVVYHSKMYCLLYPSGEAPDPKRPFKQYIPFDESK